MNRFLLLLLLLYPLLSFSQAKHIDSLTVQLQKAKTDSGKVLLLNDLAYAYHAADPHKGVTYGNEALQLSRRLNMHDGEAQAHNNLGMNYLQLSDHPRALTHFMQSLEIYEGLEQQNKKRNAAAKASYIEKKAGINGNIGMVYFRQGKFPKALENYFQALKIYEGLQDTAGIARINGNIAIVYFVQKDYEQAMAFATAALKLYEQLDDKTGIARNIEIIGLIFTEQQNYPAALEYTFRSLEMHRQLNHKNDIGINLGNIGGIYLAIARDSVHKDIHAQTGISRAAALSKAVYYLDQAIALMKETRNLDPLQSFYKDLSDAYALSGNYGPALGSFKQHIFYKDSVFSRQNAEKISAIETQKEIELRDQQIRINELTISKKRNENLFFIALTSLSIGLIIFIFSERKKSERLLLNVLPKKIADRLKNKKSLIADYFPSASIIFIDMVGFTTLVSKQQPGETIALLNDIFSSLDALTDKYGMEKIKTIGDCYMAVAGVPEERPDHADVAARMALEVKRIMKEYKTPDGNSISFRIGLNCGPVTAGVIGKKKFTYDLWGDTVNTASRMESYGIPNEIQCSDDFKKALTGNYHFVSRGMMDIKGKGPMQTWLLYE